MGLLRQLASVTAILVGVICFGGNAFARLSLKSECRAIRADPENSCYLQSNKSPCEQQKNDHGQQLCEWYENPQAYVKIRNTCIRPIRISVAAGSFGMSQPPSKFHEIAPGKTSDELLSTELPILYFYAESIDQPGLELVWGGNAIFQSIQGSQQQYGFAETRIRTDQFCRMVFEINCDGSAPFHQISLFWGTGTFGVGLGRNEAEADERAMQMCAGGRPDSGCAKATSVDGTVFRYMVLTGGDGNLMFGSIADQQQPAINDAMNQCMRATTNCKIIGEYSN